MTPPLLSKLLILKKSWSEGISGTVAINKSLCKCLWSQTLIFILSFKIGLNAGNDSFTFHIGEGVDSHVWVFSTIPIDLTLTKGLGWPLSLGRFSAL
ncbi:unnamed protein product [Blepharisma stoltei]|uniref:Uncharacterized protein n=1 Tax=Blepharisma stoltei TaxID=1481888 RepID=A0AAU9JVX7_9CILI|nr:unnamed protein product [Blepharisma stoltei]